MAESIYKQLETGRAITPVNGVDYEAPLPEGLFPTAEQFENPDKLVAWSDENGHTAKLIQKGLQKAIIEVRATFKSCPKDETWTEAMGLTNVADMKWKDVKRPETAMSDKEKAISALGKLSPAELAEIMANM